jgi:hypothetical protein
MHDALVVKIINLSIREMSPLNNKRTTSSLAPPIFYVAKKLAIKG